MANGKVYPARVIGGPPRLPSQWESRAAYQAAVEKAQALHEQQVMRETHERLQKLNAKLEREGRPPAYSCPPSCTLCYPPKEPEPAKADVEKVKDLRGSSTTEKASFFKGKRGVCRVCGEKIRGVPNWFLRYYHDECRPKGAWKPS